MIVETLQQSVFRLRASTGTDTYGDPVLDWTQPERIRLRNAIVGEPRNAEVEGGASRTLSGTRELRVLGLVDLTAADRIEDAGVVWRVEGEPRVHRSLAAGTFTAATLVRAEVKP